jgi:purine-binding chemotaxis protein CheW
MTTGTSGSNHHDEGEDDQFLTFGLASEMFAVPVAKVREVLDVQHVTPMANAPSALLGLIDVRGLSVPVIDLKQKLGMGSKEPSDHSRILVLQLEGEQGPMVLGALTDAVYEVTQLSSEAVKPAPATGLAWDHGYMAGIGRHNGKFVTLLDLDRVFAHPDSGFAFHG